MMAEVMLKAGNLAQELNYIKEIVPGNKVLEEPPLFSALRGIELDYLTGGIAMKQTKIFSAFLMIVLFAFVVGCASKPKQEGTGEYIDDTVITTKVKAAILGEPTLKSAEINVETFKGVVQMSGFVNSAADIDKAIELTRRVEGVKSIKNDMRLK